MIIPYLITSTLSMTLLLLVYHFFLGNEKMHGFNRIYLLFSLVFSFTIPLIPIGIADGITGGGISHPSEVFERFSSATGAGNTVHIQEVIIKSIVLKAVPVLYGLITLILFVRLINNIDFLLYTARINTNILYGNAIIVLLKEKTIPFSFLSYIFLSEERYLEGKIKKEVLIHENTHVCQKHSLDVLFIEILKVFFWFIPVLYFYKRAIQLNHEFLADQAVVFNNGRLSVYQSLLLHTSLRQYQYALASNFNFTMIKKRLLMMAHETSRTRSVVKQLAVLPVFAGAALIFGCEVTTHESNQKEPVREQIVRVDILNSEVIKLNGKTMDITMLEEQLAVLPKTPGLIVEFRVQPEAYVGTVVDVQNVLREKNLLRINYLVTRPNFMSE